MENAIRKAASCQQILLVFYRMYLIGVLRQKINENWKRNYILGKTKNIIFPVLINASRVLTE